MSAKGDCQLAIRCWSLVALAVDVPVGDASDMTATSWRLAGELVRDRDRPPEQWAALFADGWPAFIDADQVATACLPRVRTAFDDLRVALTRLGPDRGGGEGAEFVAAAWGVPIAWDGDPADLPDGYSDALTRALTRALADAEEGVPVETLVVCAAQVRLDAAGAGLAARVLSHLMDVAAGQGLHRVVAPLRPTLKHRYPLTPIQDYATWTRPDGQPLDPWLRTHLRMGATVVATTETSQTFTGTVAQWQTWSGLELPACGRYLVEGALAPMVLDHSGDRGILTEPGIWVRHR